MKYLLSLFASCLLVFSLVGCGGSGHHGPVGNLYLTDVLVGEDNSVVAVVNLPDQHYGLLYLNDSNVALAILIGSGEVELGVFEAGDYNLCLELFLRPDAVIPQRRTFNTFKDLTGTVECLDFVVPVLGDDPVDPPDDPDDPGDDPDDPDDPGVPGKPTLVCNLNEDGAAVLTIELKGHNPCILRRLFDEDNDVVVEGDLTVADLPLSPGEYKFSLLDLDTGEELASCVLTVPAPPGQDDDDDDDEVPELPPRPDDPRTRFVICHNGKTLLVPWPALKAHLLIHGDTLGACE